MSHVAELHLIKQRLAELEETVEIIDRGITKKETRLRDEFAIAAMTGLIGDTYEMMKEIADSAYLQADAMMEARGK